MGEGVITELLLPSSGYGSLLVPLLFVSGITQLGIDPATSYPGSGHSATELLWLLNPHGEKDCLFLENSVLKPPLGSSVCRHLLLLDINVQMSVNQSTFVQTL